ncbi:uncharacterized protein LOC108344480 [Vigna angularis]|uniref:uncharacterized protein LOC108344480 n=1 Tax=Phaseolus angularis TaxID=3914 RepID=UPI00080A2EAB|nr:uncharacterized protein LOC108344480 [Vigna angularis]
MVRTRSASSYRDEASSSRGGPHDTSLLTHYTQYVAFAIWQGQDRGKIKVMSHGKKLKHFIMYHEAIEPYISMSGLASIVNLSYEYVDHGLIVSLAKRWHLETNTFHLPIGEMSVTLDDVHNLLHLPIMGQFCEIGDASFTGVRQIAGYSTLLQSWIYEHLSGMEKRRVSDRYIDLDPRATRYIPPRQGWSHTEGRTYLDGLTYDVIIPCSPESLPIPDIPTIDLNWLRYVKHAISGVVEAHEPSVYVDGYLLWFRRVSHPYITPTDDDDRPSLAPRMRRHLLDDILCPQFVVDGLLNLDWWYEACDQDAALNRDVCKTGH